MILISLISISLKTNLINQERWLHPLHQGLVVDDDDGDDDDDDDDDDDIEADVMSGGIAASGDGRAEEDNY